jgi:hypothetical protein
MWQWQTDPPCRMSPRWTLSVLDAVVLHNRYKYLLAKAEKPSEVERLMSLNKITSSELRTLIAIVERKESLQEELAKIESKLSAYLSPEPTTPATRARRSTPKPSADRVSKPLEGKAPKSKVRQAESTSAPLSLGPKPGQRPGALKDSILAALQKAGDEGLAVKDLAAALGVKSRNIHVWFSSTGRKVKGLTKVGAGRWKYNGN